MLELERAIGNQTPVEQRATRVLVVTATVGGAVGVAILLLAAIVASDHQSIAGSVAGASATGGILFLTSVCGLWGALRERKGRSGRRQLLVYFYACLVTLLLILFFSIGALEFRDTFEHYVETHWDSVQSEFPELRGLNRTEAVHRAEELVGRNFTVVGSVGLASVLCLASGIWASATILTWPVVMQDVLKLVNAFFILCGSAVLAFAAFVAQHHQISPGLGWLPIATAAAAATLVLVGVAGCYAAVSRSERTRVVLKAYLGALALVLACLAAFAALSFIFAGEVRERFEAMPDDDFRRAVAESGVGRNVTKDEFEGILESNLRFMGLGATLVVLFAALGIVAACRYSTSMQFYQYGTV